MHASPAAAIINANRGMLPFRPAPVPADGRRRIASPGSALATETDAGGRSRAPLDAAGSIADCGAGAAAGRVSDCGAGAAAGGVWGAMFQSPGAVENPPNPLNPERSSCHPPGPSACAVRPAPVGAAMSASRDIEAASLSIVLGIVRAFRSPLSPDHSSPGESIGTPRRD
jgi:hypothetical protein